MTERKLVAFAAALAAVLPGAALAQDAPPPEADIPDEVYEARTGTRIQHVVVIGAIRDRDAPARTERTEDRRLPDLPVTYEDEPAR